MDVSPWSQGAGIIIPSQDGFPRLSFGNESILPTGSVGIAIGPRLSEFPPLRNPLEGPDLPQQDAVFSIIMTSDSTHILAEDINDTLDLGDKDRITITDEESQWEQSDIDNIFCNNHYNHDNQVLQQTDITQQTEGDPNQLGNKGVVQQIVEDRNQLDSDGMFQSTEGDPEQLDSAAIFQSTEGDPNQLGNEGVVQQIVEDRDQLDSDGMFQSTEGDPEQLDSDAIFQSTEGDPNQLGNEGVVQQTVKDHIQLNNQGDDQDSVHHITGSRTATLRRAPVPKSQEQIAETIGKL